MIPRVLLDSADVPGGGELRLYRRGAEFSILLGGNELMSSRTSGSEEALATLGCTGLGEAPRVLIGGLGMGFTLRAALATLGAEARITVAELVPAVIGWARGAMAELFAGSLEDPRVTVFEGDVAEVIAQGGWDAILLDVDNGPDGLTRPGNDRLYGASGLARARTALRSGGVLAIWSAAADRRFTARLKEAGFTVDEHDVRARGGTRGARHVIWVGRA